MIINSRRHQNLSPAQEEERRVRMLARVMDGALGAISSGRFSDPTRAWEMAGRVKRLALALFPDKESVFDLIYLPRLQRAIRERFPPH